MIQCPPQFGFTAQNVRNMKKFFNGIDRDGIPIAWEREETGSIKPNSFIESASNWIYFTASIS